MKKLGIVIVIAFLAMLSGATGATASETNTEVPSEVLEEGVSDGGVIVEILDASKPRQAWILLYK